MVEADGFSGPNPLGRRRPLLAASGVLPNFAAIIEGPRPPDLPALSVVNHLRNLPLAERLELLQTLWDSIAAGQRDPELSAADRQQINKRMEAFLADGDPGLDAESMIDAIKQSL